MCQNALTAHGELSSVACSGPLTPASRDRICLCTLCNQAMRKWLHRPCLCSSDVRLRPDHDDANLRDTLQLLSLEVAVNSLDTQSFADTQTMKAALSLFKFGQDEAAQRGLLLVDTKYEFGKAPDGSIKLVDEIHTPDSSRSVLASAIRPYQQKSNIWHQQGISDPKKVQCLLPCIICILQGLHSNMF